jgi:hypothetical protein
MAVSKQARSDPWTVCVVGNRLQSDPMSGLPNGRYLRYGSSHCGSDLYQWVMPGNRSAGKVGGLGCVLPVLIYVREYNSYQDDLN